jgi:hypothetical protein
MKKEKVIIFEGEHNFVIPKNRVRDKKTGISYYVPDNMNVVGVDKSGITPIDETQLDAPKEPDEPIRIIKPPPSGSSDISVKTFGGGTGGAGTITKGGGETGDRPPPLGGGGQRGIDLGDPIKIVADEELTTTTSTTTSTTTKIAITIDIPTGLGGNPITSSGLGSKLSGGGGGGGGSKDATATAKKTFLQKYWWLLLLVAAGGGYYYYKKKNK